MKNFFKYFAPTLVALFIIGGTALAASILSVPGGGTGAGTFTTKSLIVSNSAKATGTLQSLAPGTNGFVLSSSSTAASGFAWIANTAATGATTTITSNVLINGPNFTFATGTETGLNLNVTGSGSTITFAPQLQAGYNIPLTASTTNWNGLYNNVLSRLSVATGTAGNIFNISTSTNSIIINLPFASGSNTGQLQAADWTTFNNKVATTRTLNTTAPITGGGDLSADRTIACNVASGSQAGCLATTDWLLFNNKLSGSLVAGQIVYASGASSTQSSSLFTFSTGTGLTNTATSTLATTTVNGALTVNSSGATSFEIYADGGASYATSTLDATTTLAVAGQYYSSFYDNGTSTATTTIDWGKSNTQRIGVNTTTSVGILFANQKAGGRYLLEVQLASSTAQTVNWPSLVHFSQASTPALTAGTYGQIDIYTFICGNGSTTINCYADSSLNYSP